jgi:hypothetical protein
MPVAAVDFQGGVSSAWSNVITFVPKLAAALQRYWERTATRAEQRAPELRQQAQQSVSTSVADEGNGAAAYADTGTREFPAQRTSRLRRDR